MRVSHMCHICYCCSMCRICVRILRYAQPRCLRRAGGRACPSSATHAPPPLRMPLLRPAALPPARRRTRIAQCHAIVVVCVVHMCPHSTAYAVCVLMLACQSYEQHMRWNAPYEQHMRYYAPHMLYVKYTLCTADFVCACQSYEQHMRYYAPHMLHVKYTLCTAYAVCACQSQEQHMRCIASTSACRILPHMLDVSSCCSYGRQAGPRCICVRILPHIHAYVSAFYRIFCMCQIFCMCPHTPMPGKPGRGASYGWRLL
jgi:hypothetical protein